MRTTRKLLIASTAAAWLLAGGSPSPAAAGEPPAGGAASDTRFAEPAPDRPQPIKCRVTPQGTVCEHPDPDVTPEGDGTIAPRGSARFPASS